MAIPRSRLVRTAAWVAGATLLLLGAWARQRHSDTYFENVRRSEAVKRPAPILLGRGVPEAPAPTGEATAQPGEAWFDDRVLKEWIEDEEPRSIAGRVLDTDGRPLDGIDIRVVFDDDGPLDPAWDDYGAATGEDGLFVLSGLPDRTFRLTAERVRWSRLDWRKGRPTGDDEGAWVERTVVEGVRAGRRDVRIRMAALPRIGVGLDVRVRVVGPDGKDVPAWGYTACANGSAWTGIEGKIEPEPGQPGIVSFLSGYPPFGLIITSPATKDWAELPFAPGFVSIDGAREGPYVVHLKRAGAIRGRVALEGAEPTANVLVRYAVLTSGRAEDPERVTADGKDRGAFMWDMVGTEEDGSFVLHGLPPGRVRLVPLHHEASREAALPSAGQTVRVGDASVRLRLPAHAPIRGTLDWQAVKDAQDLSFQVHVSRLARGRERVFWSKHLSASDVRKEAGGFATPPLPTTEEFTVEVWATGQLPGAGAIQVALASRRIERVRPGGSPLFVVLALAPELRGHLERADGAASRAGVEVQAMRLGVDALFVAAGLAGDEVDDYAPRPASAVREAPGNGPHVATTDFEGAFRFAGLRSGRYVVWTAGAVVQRAVAGGDEVRLRPGSGHRVTGRVRTQEGGLPPGFVVEARPAGTTGGVLASTVVRTDGYFALRGLPEGPYGLTIYNAQDPTETRVAFYRPVPSGTRRLDVRLEAGRQLQGVVRDERGGSAEGTLVTVTSRWDKRRVHVARDGTFRIGGLVAAAFDVAVALPDGRRASVSAAAGDLVALQVR